MRVYTKVVWDMLTGRRLEEHSYEYSGPVALAGKKKPDPRETEAAGISAQQRAKQDIATGRAQGTLGQFEGPVEQSPFYRALLGQSMEGTSRAYGAARANTRARGRAAGFGYAQPIVGGAEDELGAQEAARIGALPREAMLGAAPLAMQAAGVESNIGSQYGAGGTSYFGDATELAKQRLQPRGGLWKSLAKLGMLGASMIPGIGPAVSAGLQVGAGTDF